MAASSPNVLAAGSRPYLCYSAVMDGGMCIASLEIAMRLAEHPELQEDDFTVALRTMAERWGHPIVEVSDEDFSPLLETVLRSPEYCEENNAYLQATGAYQTVALEEGLPTGPRDISHLEPILGAKAFMLLQQVFVIGERFVKVAQHLNGVDLAAIVLNPHGPMQSRHTVLDFIDDSALPPEVELILFQLEEATLCGFALDYIILQASPVSPRRANLLLKKIITGLTEYIRLLASIEQGRSIPPSLVPIEDRYPVELWEKYHQGFRQGIRAMRDEMLRLGLDRYAPHQIPEDDEDE